MGAEELDRLTMTELHAYRRAWDDRECRLEDRAARAALFLAAKVWDSKGLVKVEDLFPSIDPDRYLTADERAEREWAKVKVFFEALPAGADGRQIYAIDRSDQG